MPKNVNEKKLFLFDVLNLVSKIIGRKRWNFLILFIFLQLIIGFLDLVGAFFLTLVMSIFVATISNDQSNPIQIYNFYKLEFFYNLTSIQIMFYFSLLATFFFLFKSGISLFLIKKMFLYLGKINLIIVRDLLGKFFSKDLLFIQKKSPKHTSHLLTYGSTYLSIELIGPLAIALSETVLLILFLILLFLIDKIITLGACLLFGILGIILHKYLNNRATIAGQIESESQSLSEEGIHEGISSFRTLVTFSSESYFIGSVSKFINLSSKALSQRRFFEQIPKFSFEFALILGLLSLGLFYIQSSNPSKTSFAILIFLAVALRSIPSMLRLQNAIFAIKYALGRVVEVVTFIKDLENTPNRSLNSLSDNFPIKAPFNGSIKFINVSFDYPHSGVRLIKDLSFEIGAGDSLAIVGKSGSGKSTLLDLILGIIQLSKGKIFIGEETPGTALELWRREISYVPQNSILLGKTLLENVAFGLDYELIDRKSVMEALNQVDLLDFALNLPDGLKTRIGLGGIQLSGGEKQRLGLSRALYFKPKLLLLDEATSALDSKSELTILENLHINLNETTFIYTTHKVNQIRDSDFVLNLDEKKFKGIINGLLFKNSLNKNYLTS